MNGYHGCIVDVDLTTRRGQSWEFDPAFARAYLGGNGFAAHLLYARVPAGTDPYAPDNLAVFACGPLSDSPIPGGSRTYAGFKSPLTGLYFDSTFGGRFARTLKRSGWDAAALGGAADAPVYVLLEPGGVQVHDAGDLWGRSIGETTRILRQRHGADADVAAIGPAGENGVRFACVGHHWQGKESYAGRGGLGAVLGAKKCKALVVRGDLRAPLADREALRALAARGREALAQGAGPLSEYGTAVIVEPINALGGLGTRNLARETCAQASALSGETYRDRFYLKSTSCAGCPVACGKTSRVSEGPYAPLTAKTPEYESLFALGTMLEIYDPAAVLEANRLCDELGLDTISMGVTLAFVCECLERGLLSESEVGVPLRFGDADGALELIRRCAQRSGFGAQLAEGSVRLAAALGGEAHRYLYAARGLEIAAHSARILKGMSLGYATATRGGSHQDTRPALQYTPETDNRSPQPQPAFAIQSQHFTAVGDSLAQCRLVAERGFGRALNEDYAALVRGATGWDVDVAELERIGERIYNLERAFNVREGVRRKDDTLPYRVMHEPVPDGPHRGMHCPPEELDGMLDAYYRLRGWSPEGVPTRERLTALGLASVVDDLGA